MIPMVKFISEEEQIYNLNIKNNTLRGTLKEVHIADIHFGVLDPKYQYTILTEQFTNKLINLDFDVLVIDGDLYEHKFMSSSDPIMYASLFVNDLINLCRIKSATFVILHGTKLHDDNQLKMFYHYLTDETVDVRIVETPKFEYIKGAKVLCIPEMNNLESSIYENLLYYSGWYDTAFVHGEYLGSIYREKNVVPTLEGHTPIFTLDHFCYCKGPILSGHVHVTGCFAGYYYYCGSPYRWKFGEEQEKGFLIALHNLDTQWHYVHLEPIKSYRYDTINLDMMLIQDPKDVIEYVNKLQEQGIDYIRLEFKKELNDKEIANLEILKKYYRSIKTVKLKIDNAKKNEMLKANEELMQQYSEYDFIMDKNLSPEEIFCRYVNIQEGCEFISVNELVELLKEE